MLKRFIVVLVCLMMVASMSTVFATQGLAGSGKTISGIGKGQQIVATDEMTMTFKDQLVLMMYIRAIDKMMNNDQIDSSKYWRGLTQLTTETDEWLDSG